MKTHRPSDVPLAVLEATETFASIIAGPPAKALVAWWAASIDAPRLLLGWPGIFNHR